VIENVAAELDLTLGLSGLASVGEIGRDAVESAPVDTPLALIPPRSPFWAERRACQGCPAALRGLDRPYVPPDRRRPKGVKEKGGQGGRHQCTRYVAMTPLSPPSPAKIGQIALKLTRLSAEEVSGLLEIVDQLEPEETACKARTAAEIREVAKRRAALLRDVPRELVAARFTELAEEIRQEAIAKGTAIDGDWTDD